MPPTNGFTVDDGGHIYVSTFERAPGGRVYWDVFDSRGAIVARAALPFSIPGDDVAYRTAVVIRSDRLYRLCAKSDGYQEIRVSRIEWK